MPRHVGQLLMMSVALSAMPSFALSMEVRPNVMVLGRDSTAQLLFKGFADSADKVKVTCTAGDVAALHAEGADLAAEWVAPKSVEPQVILCAAISPSGAA